MPLFKPFNQDAMQMAAAYADTHLESMCKLNIDSKPHAHRMSGIICTIGKTTFTNYPEYYHSWLMTSLIKGCSSILKLECLGQVAINLGAV